MFCFIYGAFTIAFFFFCLFAPQLYVTMHERFVNVCLFLRFSFLFFFRIVFTLTMLLNIEVFSCQRPSPPLVLNHFIYTLVFVSWRGICKLKALCRIHHCHVTLNPWIFRPSSLEDNAVSRHDYWDEVTTVMQTLIHIGIRRILIH